MRRNILNYRFLTLTYFSLTIVLSLVLFFKNTNIPIFFEKDNFDWYAKYAQTIFHPDYFVRGGYYAESILLPILAKLIGAAKSIIAFKVFCAAIELAILPVLAFHALNYFKSALMAFLFVLIFSLTFIYFKQYVLGFPDPLTVLLLIGLPLISSPILLAVCAALAMLSHFSMAFLAVLVLIPLICLSKSPARMVSSSAIYILIGAVIGRGILQIWYWIFDYYNPLGRIQWVLTHGIEFFVERYQADTGQFWLTPGLWFLITYVLCVLIALWHKKYLFCLASIGSLLIAYTVLFLTVDGLRGFAVVICPSYVLILSYSIKLAADSLNAYRQQLASESGT
jgi:hypothetical protein